MEILGGNAASDEYHIPRHAHNLHVVHTCACPVACLRILPVLTPPSPLPPDEGTYDIHGLSESSRRTHRLSHTDRRSHAQFSGRLLQESRHSSERHAGMPVIAGKKNVFQSLYNGVISVRHLPFCMLLCTTMGSQAAD